MSECQRGSHGRCWLCEQSPWHECPDKKKPMTQEPTPADPRLDEWLALANAATKGPWDIDTINVDGSYGSGDTGGEGYNSYEVHSADGKCLFDAINSDAAMIDEEYDEYGIRHAWDEIARQNLTFVAAAREAIPALIAMVREANDRALEWEGRSIVDSNALRHAKARTTAAEAEVERLQTHIEGVAKDTQKITISLTTEVERLREALAEAADELDAYYEREYPDDHPYSVKKLAQAKASNPARALKAKHETGSPIND